MIFKNSYKVDKNFKRKKSAIQVYIIVLRTDTRNNLISITYGATQTCQKLKKRLISWKYVL